MFRFPLAVIKFHHRVMTLQGVDTGNNDSIKRVIKINKCICLLHNAAQNVFIVSSSNRKVLIKHMHDIRQTSEFGGCGFLMVSTCRFCLILYASIRRCTHHLVFFGRERYYDDYLVSVMALLFLLLFDERAPAARRRLHNYQHCHMSDMMPHSSERRHAIIERCWLDDDMMVNILILR